ncbi:hypothetical protein [Halegenticoccus tardaugens]|uniref:hypothetical protein n=1 Tax=Halegenticoccus tardaugens TaxID=2071624 RepID=UPI00100C204F|nr:hypothetical protein [Halegenticoccus tardaugens]
MSNKFETDVAPADVAFYGRPQHERATASEREWYGGEDDVSVAEYERRAALAHYHEIPAAIAAPSVERAGATT